MFVAKLLKKADAEKDALLEELMHFFRANKPKVRSLLNRPYPERAIEDFLIETFPEDLSALLSPLFHQRAQDTMTDSVFKMALQKALMSPPVNRALKEDEA